MECGQRLLGLLELGGAILFTAGLAVRAAVHRLSSGSMDEKKSISGQRVLILGENKTLGGELIKQFVDRGCLVAYAGAHKYKNANCKHYACNSTDPKQIASLTEVIERDFGELDILVYAADNTKSHYREPIDEVVDLMDKNLVEHFHVVTNFVPTLAKRAGRFVTIEPQRSVSGSFSVTNLAITALSDTLIQQIANPSSGIKVTRALRRTRRRHDYENAEESAQAILNAIEAGRSSVTLPTAKQHIKNTLRNALNALSQLWKNTITDHKLAT